MQTTCFNTSENIQRLYSVQCCILLDTSTAVQQMEKEASNLPYTLEQTTVSSGIVTVERAEHSTDFMCLLAFQTSDSSHLACR
jgi:hypothetical protein